ncbi:FAD-dependent monooxygenase [Janibacter limosus]|uniref:FAD-dependent monooxygenase n=1 Tax=Janibacter limosus TaxID=53458 RepID=UPI0035E39BA4
MQRTRATTSPSPRPSPAPTGARARRPSPRSTSSGAKGGPPPRASGWASTSSGHSPSTRWVVIDVNNDPLGLPNVYLGADPARPYVSIGLPHGIRRWEFMLFDDEPSEQVEDPTFVAALLKDHVPDSSTLDVIRCRVFTHHGRIASSFRRGRVLIAGDAAHLMPVWMGRGWNSGMRDATNLSWKLASVLAGRADDSILDSFEAERHEHAKAMIDLSMTLGNVIKPTNRVVCGARDLASRALNLSPRVKSYFTDMRFKPMPFYAKGVVVAPDSLTPGEQPRTRTSSFMTIKNAVDKKTPVGVQFPQPRVNTVDVTGARLDDVTGEWWTVAARGNDPARLFTEDERAQLQHMGARFVSFMSESQRPWAQAEHAGSGTLVVGDVDGSIKGWFDKHAMGVVFLRPDRFVGAACPARESGKALAALRVAMGATRVGLRGSAADGLAPQPAFEGVSA